MKLYFSPGSCGLASQIALREAKQTFELIKVDFNTKMTVEGDYYKVNPKGFVPVLKLDDGNTFTEGAVILQVIADKFPEANLLPAFGSRERYTALEWLNFVATDLHKGMAVMFSSLIDKTSKSKFAEGNLINKFEYIDAHMSNKEYILGDQFSVADAYLYNVLSWAPRVNLDITKYNHVQKFMERMETRPAVRASLEGEGLRFKE